MSASHKGIRLGTANLFGLILCFSNVASAQLSQELNEQSSVVEYNTSTEYSVPSLNECDFRSIEPNCQRIEVNAEPNGGQLFTAYLCSQTTPPKKDGPVRTEPITKEGACNDREDEVACKRRIGFACRKELLDDPNSGCEVFRNECEYKISIESEVGGKGLRLTDMTTKGQEVLDSGDPEPASCSVKDGIASCKCQYKCLYHCLKVAKKG